MSGGDYLIQVVILCLVPRSHDFGHKLCVIHGIVQDARLTFRLRWELRVQKAGRGIGQVKAILSVWRRRRVFVAHGIGIPPDLHILLTCRFYGRIGLV